VDIQNHHIVCLLCDIFHEQFWTWRFAVVYGIYNSFILLVNFYNMF
jgi:hypothetical protein